MDEEIDKVKKEIDKVKKDIEKVEQRTLDVERKLESVTGDDVPDLRREKKHLWRTEEQLRNDLEQLRRKEEQFQKKEEQLRERNCCCSGLICQVIVSMDGCTLDFVDPWHLSYFCSDVMLVMQVQRGFADRANRINLSERTKCDFDFKVMEDWKPGFTLDTAAIAVALKEFGGFLPRYYVRLEETMVFTNCLNILAEQEHLGAVISGSPGVGKSVFLVLLAFYLAHVHLRSVIILRKLKRGQPMPLACIHVCREGYSGSRFRELAGIHGILDKLEQPLFFVDGFTQEDINRDYGYLGDFNLLATCSQYRLKSDDGYTGCILLPAWRPEDLRDYADRMGTFPSNFEENFESAYSYSGGSLREFLKSDVERKNVFFRAMRSLELGSVHNLLLKYGAGSTSQVDTIRKLFVKNRLDPKHYVTIAKWVPAVDSSVAVRELYDRLSEEDFLTILIVAEGIGRTFYGNAFEWYIHKRASSDGGLSFEAWQYNSKSRIGEFDVPGGAAVCEGERLTDCHEYLKLWRTEDTKYWFPNMMSFSNIDFIAKCDRVIDGDKDKLQKYLVYIQITTAGSHTLDAGMLNTLDNIFKDEYPNRVYIALLPEKASIQAFTLTGDLQKSQIPRFISTICSGGRKRKRK